MKLSALLAGVAALAASCSPSPPESETLRDLVVQVASYDLAVSEQRIITGVLTEDQEFLSGGTVEMAFARLVGKEQPQFGSSTVANFLTLPGEEEPPATVTPASGSAHPSGVYAASVEFDEPGNWLLQLTAEFDGELHSGEAAFTVGETNQVPTRGDAAPRTVNHVIGSEVPAIALDSRAKLEGLIPDPQLHSTTVSDALDDGLPVVLVLSTPVYCVSRFCGPITEMVEVLANDYQGAAAFIHIEIWKDRDAGVINEAAAEWLFREGDLQEPWVFLIGRDGSIAKRWDNVTNRAEVESELKRLL